MEKKDLIPWGDAVSYLKIAALHPQRRDEMIACALQELLICLSAVGTALIWPCQDRNVPWKIYYVGARRESMQYWLTDRLDVSLDATISVIQEDLSSLSDMPIPHLICLEPAPRFPAGLWIVWTEASPISRAISDCLERVRLTLEALIEVECSEESYFSSSSPLTDRALIEALWQGNTQALSVLLGLTRMAGNAELVFWGRTYQDVIEIKDKQGGIYGDVVAVPRGRGVGGRMVTYGTPIVVIKDYLTCSYRDPSTASFADDEQIRSLIALPVHSRQGQEMTREVGGVLYISRRTVKPFSLAERLLAQRMTRLLEPLRPLTRPSSFLMPDLLPVADLKPAWYKDVLHANQRS